MKFLLGIDAGTSVIKAALFDRDGRTHAVASRRTTIYNPQPAWSEANMDEFWQLTAAAIREVVSQVDAKTVAAFGITGNMVGAWLIDAAGQPVRDAILWNDGRTQNDQTPEVLAQIFRSSGSVMQPGCTLPLVRWLSEHEPAVLQRAAHVLCCKDWLRYQLTGTLFTDQSEASVMPGDTRARTYNESLFDLLGVRNFRHLFPPAVPSEQICGHVTPEAAALTGLPVGTPVVAGAGDVPASALGAGAVEAGVACIVLGTTCLSCLVTPQPVFEPANVGLLFPLPPNHWLRVMANIAGTTNLDWFAAQLYGSDVSFDQLEHEAAAIPPGADGVIYHPYLSPAGVIAPFVESGARAQFFGLLPTHTRAHLLRAVYEGVALAIRDCYAAMNTPICEVRLSGGGARSPLWCQMIADCLDARVLIPAGDELGAKGAALLAGLGIGWYASVAEAASSGIERAYEPQNVEIYKPIYARYVAVREALRSVWSG